MINSCFEILNKYYKMNYLKLLFFIGLVTTFTKSEAQLVDKIGGVCFRIDDTQSPNNLKALDSIFSKHGKRFTYAPNTQIANFTQSADFWSTLKFLQVRGHEIGDHTPNHYTQFFDILTSDSLKLLLFLDVKEVLLVLSYLFLEVLQTYVFHFYLQFEK